MENELNSNRGEAGIWKRVDYRKTKTYPWLDSLWQEPQFVTVGAGSQGSCFFRILGFFSIPEQESENLNWSPRQRALAGNSTFVRVIFKARLGELGADWRV